MVSTLPNKAWLMSIASRLNAGVSSAGYTENHIRYDDMGNILALTRQGTTHNYSYSGNQLQTVSGLTTGSYTYDGNGNVHFDARLGKTINYNILDLPLSVTATGFSLAYTYDANGRKLRRDNGTTVTDYINGIQYDNGNISFIQTEDGRAVNNSGTYNYEYSLTDQLGNNRVSFGTTSGAAAAVQAQDYYPFGLVTSQPLVATPKNNYLYNNKELQEDLGQYDYGARLYDPMIGRWGVVDKYAEHPDQIDLSPYVYVGNNPIDKNDPDGNCSKCLPVVNCANCNVSSREGSVRPSSPPGSNLTFGDVEQGANKLSTGGMIVEGAGLAAAFIPGTEEFAPFLISTGSNMAVTGTVISAGTDFANGKTANGLLKLGTAAVFKTIDMKIDALKVAKQLTTTGKNILGVNSFAAGKVADKLIEKGTSKNKVDDQKSTNSSVEKQQAEPKKKEEPKKTK